MPGLHRYVYGQEKYTVLDAQGQPIEGPYFVLRPRDPAAAAALNAYRIRHDFLGTDPEYTGNEVGIERLIRDFETIRLVEGNGSPSEPPVWFELLQRTKGFLSLLSRDIQWREGSPTLRELRSLKTAIGKVVPDGQ